MSNLVDQAKDLINVDRQNQYGSPVKNFKTIAEFWTSYLKSKFQFSGELNQNDVCQMMMLLKQSRLINNEDHKDSKVDMIGYLLIQEGICTGEFK